MSKKKHVRVYSYIRFSTPEQAMGDSERRQVDDAKAWAKHEGYVLDVSLDLTDRGFSGYHGHHRKKGALGRFLSKVEAGAIPKGSILLVENIDRLSREGAVKVLREVIFKLWDHGISLQTLSPEDAYPPGCESDAKFLALLIYIQRAQDESLQKSRRIKKARKAARQAAHDEKKILTSRAPAWLEVKDDKFVAIPEAAKTVRLIFELKLKGLSTRAIERQLNEVATWTPPPQRKKQRTSGWRASYIKKILNNRVVIGEYQAHHTVKGKRQPIGDPVEGYFPVVVKPHKFHAVQKQLADNRRTGGRADKFNNVLKHLVRCAYCGGPMRYDDKGNNFKYFVCYNGERNAGCRNPIPYRMRYTDVSELILDNCPKLKPEQVLPNPEDQSKRCLSLREKIEGLASEVDDIERKQNNLADLIADEDDEGIRRRLRDKLLAIQERRPAVEEMISQAQRQLREAERDSRSFSQWKSDLTELRTSIVGCDREAIEMRMQLNAHLRDLIESVELFAEGYPIRPDEEPSSMPKRPAKSNNRVKHRPRPEQQHDSFLEEMEDHIANHDKALFRDAMFMSFVRHVANLRHTKRGRFLRVKFKTGVVVELVPDGSLASGMEMVKDGRRRKGWRFVSPRLERGWRDFQTDYKKKNASNKC